METRLHRRRQAALERTVDLHGSRACRLVAFELSQDEHEVLSQIPKRFHVLCEADPLTCAADLLTGVGLQQQKHACPDVLKPVLARAALDKIWKREQSK